MEMKILKLHGLTKYYYTDRMLKTVDNDWISIAYIRGIKDTT